MTPSQAADAIRKALNRKITETIKELLEAKHLYQSLDVNVAGAMDSIVAEVKPGFPSARNFPQELAFHGLELLGKRWFVFDPRGDYTAPDKNCTVFAPDIKAFCVACDRIEPFNVMAANEYSATSPKLASTIEFKTQGGLLQNFLFAYICQGCKSRPELFLVRRVGPKLTICGRSPIEHVDVPAVMPKSVRHFFFGAIVAHQSGQTLAGLFMLRTVIEQWVRSLGAQHPHADEALDWYMSTLPADFKERMPSLREIYGQLSDAMHSADASSPLFDSARARIEKHFDGRRLYELETPKP